MKGKNPMNKNNENARPLHTIATEAISDMDSIARAKHKYWRNMFPYLVPYAHAMLTLNTVNDKYILDSGYEIVCRFIANAATWKGETARRIKAELRKMVGLK